MLLFRHILRFCSFYNTDVMVIFIVDTLSKKKKKKKRHDGSQQTEKLLQSQLLLPSQPPAARGTTGVSVTLHRQTLFFSTSPSMATNSSQAASLLIVSEIHQPSSLHETQWLADANHWSGSLVKDQCAEWTQVPVKKLSLARYANSSGSQTVSIRQVCFPLDQWRHLCFVVIIIWNRPTH